MLARHLLAGTFAAALILGTHATAFAAAWSPSSGSTATFNYSNGGDDNGRFGNPTVLVDGFVFTPQTFIASGAAGSPGLTADRGYVHLQAVAPDQGITSVSIAEQGDFSIFNGGGVAVSGYLLVKVLDANWVGTRNFDALLAATPTMPVTNAAGLTTGAWSGVMTVTLPAAAQSVQVVFNDILQTYSLPNGSAVIEKKGVDLTIVTAAVPEPAAMAGMAGLLLLVVRRKMA